MGKRIFGCLALFIFLGLYAVKAQTVCTTLGQNPGSAFPVCGTDTFHINSVAVCGNFPIASFCPNDGLTDKNPYWYKFKCFIGGTFAFTITPNNISDDYDWQIFDITGRDPKEVYTNTSIIVSSNWSGEGGKTGTGSTGQNLNNCGGLGVPLISKMPVLIKDHDYLLLVSHFTDSQSGYSLSFGGANTGATGSITDTVLPNLAAARAACDGTKISVKLNKRMKCSSIAADGSDFTISPAIAPITGAIGVGCFSNFDMDSVVVSLGSPLPPGNYTITIATGSDNNNLLDNCDRGIPANQGLAVTVYPLIPTPMDSITVPACAPDVINVYFSKPMYCNSISPDGSDFTVSGGAVASANGLCSSDGFTSVVQVHLATPLQTAGNHIVTIRTGNDGNSIINECGVETITGQSFSFSTIDTVSAYFSYTKQPDCIDDKIAFYHDGLHGVKNWLWTFDNTINSISKDTIISYATTGAKTATLIVSNGVCSDTVTTTIVLDPHVEANFISPNVLCPGDPGLFTDQSVGPVTAWSWDFGNGSNSNVQAPPTQYYPATNITHDINVSLTVTNAIGCTHTKVLPIKLANNCYIAIPKAFSPNGDGLNDFLYPTNAYKSTDLLFRIYNRSGQLVFETKDWNTRWDGTFKGNPQDPGTYVWILTYTATDTGKRIEQKGSTVLLR